MSLKKVIYFLVIISLLLLIANLYRVNQTITTEYNTRIADLKNKIND